MARTTAPSLLLLPHLSPSLPHLPSGPLGLSISFAGRLPLTSERQRRSLVPAQDPHSPRTKQRQRSSDRPAGGKAVVNRGNTVIQGRERPPPDSPCDEGSRETLRTSSLRAEDRAAPPPVIQRERESDREKVRQRDGERGRKAEERARGGDQGRVHVTPLRAPLPRRCRAGAAG